MIPSRSVAWADPVEFSSSLPESSHVPPRHPANGDSSTRSNHIRPIFRDAYPSRSFSEPTLQPLQWSPSIGVPPPLNHSFSPSRINRDISHLPPSPDSTPDSTPVPSTPPTSGPQYPLPRRKTVHHWCQCMQCLQSLERRDSTYRKLFGEEVDQGVFRITPSLRLVVPPADVPLLFEDPDANTRLLYSTEDGIRTVGYTEVRDAPKDQWGGIRTPECSFAFLTRAVLGKQEADVESLYELRYGTESPMDGVSEGPSERAPNASASTTSHQGPVSPARRRPPDYSDEKVSRNGSRDAAVQAAIQEAMRVLLELCDRFLSFDNTLQNRHVRSLDMPYDNTQLQKHVEHLNIILAFLERIKSGGQYGIYSTRWQAIRSVLFKIEESHRKLQQRSAKPLSIMSPISDPTIAKLFDIERILEWITGNIFVGLGPNQPNPFVVGLPFLPVCHTIDTPIHADEDLPKTKRNESLFAYERLLQSLLYELTLITTPVIRERRDGLIECVHSMLDTLRARIACARDFVACRGSMTQA